MEKDYTKNKFYITTAIAYPNGRPHMGHALEIIQADAFARFYKLLGFDVEFQTGTDEHGIKNWRTAEKQGKDIYEFLNENVNIFKELYKKLNISYNTFIRTSDKEKHYKGAQNLWKKLIESGDLYKQKYQGIYCAGCESFKTEKELSEGKCPNHPTLKLDKIEEENYFFKLSKYAPKIIEAISNDKYKIVPNSRKNEILSFLKEAKDISFSRSKNALPWGIPIPDDDEHVMYVWCDALSNYITGQGYGIGKDDNEIKINNENFNKAWPCDIHVIGKDILRFHAAFWPAMLMSANIELPKELFVHGFLNISGAKMGKSTGNVVCPFEQIEKYGVDPFRFYILGCMPIDGDGEYSEDVFIEKINNELVANIANFCFRTLSFTKKTYDGKIDSFEKNENNLKIINEILNKTSEYKNLIQKRDLKQALSKILEISSVGNRFMQENEPWKNKDTAKSTLALCGNITKIISILLKPFVPEFSNELQKQLNLENLSWNDINFNLEDHTINNAEILIRKIEKKEEKKFIANIKVAQIKDCINHPNSEKLLILKIDIGEESNRQICAGLQKFYSAESLIGKKILVISNLKTAKLGGEISQGMLLAASTPDEIVKEEKDNPNFKEVVKIIEAPDISNIGDIVTCGNMKNNENEIKIDKFFETEIIIKDTKPYIKEFDMFLVVNTNNAKKEIIINVPDGYSVG
jgi:methionyl-tRNA synthetase